MYIINLSNSQMSLYPILLHTQPTLPIIFTQETAGLWSSSSRQRTWHPSHLFSSSHILLHYKRILLDLLHLGINPESSHLSPTLSLTVCQAAIIFVWSSTLTCFMSHLITLALIMCSPRLQCLSAGFAILNQPAFLSIASWHLLMVEPKSLPLSSIPQTAVS